MRVVTIDGPAGAGKSTVARRLADCLGWRLLDTGAMYRAVTLAALRAQIALENDEAFRELVEHLTVTLPDSQVLLDGEDVSGLIRSVEITRASRYAADSPSVRKRLVAWQRSFAEAERNVITEGRDQGTIVFPNAFRKYFLTATDEERARRRHCEFNQRGETISLEVVLSDIQERDARDAARKIAPLTAAADARVVDTTGLSLDDVTSLIEQEIRQAGAMAETPR